jgi:hypothetical protein
MHVPRFQAVNGLIRVVGLENESFGRCRALEMNDKICTPVAPCGRCLLRRHALALFIMAG